MKRLRDLAVQSGDERALGKPYSTFEYLDGLQETWRGTWNARTRGNDLKIKDWFLSLEILRSFVWKMNTEAALLDRHSSIRLRVWGTFHLVRLSRVFYSFFTHPACIGDNLAA